MTEILYYDHPTVVECSAEVLSCAEKDGKYLITLSRTPIFPEGGGQLPDGGSIASRGVVSEITDCRTVNGEIVHFCTAPLAVGESVTVRLDLMRRLDHAEQHTGEHILSGLASKLFSAKNIGFHMAEDYCTIDLDIPLTAEQLSALELEANAAVRADLPIHTELTDGDDAASRPLRKRAEKAVGEVRIVYIDNGKVDSCTCCGTHLHSTGMVGSIRITDSQHYKGGTRLWFACGERAARLNIEEHSMLSSLARQYSTARGDLPAAIRRQMDELAAAKAELKAKSALLSGKLAQELIESAKNSGAGGKTLVICETASGISANDLKTVLDELAARLSGGEAWAALLFAPSSGGTEYRMGCSNDLALSMKELCAAVNAAVNGKGGGSPVFAQGKTERTVDGDTVAALRSYMLRAANN